MYDADGVEVLGRAECDWLLRRSRLGRFVFTDGMLVAVHPVAYVVDGGTVVFRTSVGDRFKAAHRMIVSFEVDDIDPACEWGWTVLVSGHAEIVTDPYEIARVTETLPESWASDGGGDVIRVSPEIVQGRRKSPVVAKVSPRAHLSADQK